MQENTRPHTPRVTINFLHGQKIPLLPWLAQSPDMIQYMCGNSSTGLFGQHQRRIASCSVLDMGYYVYGRFTNFNIFHEETMPGSIGLHGCSYHGYLYYTDAYGHTIILVIKSVTFVFDSRPDCTNNLSIVLIVCGIRLFTFNSFFIHKVRKCL